MGDVIDFKPKRNLAIEVSLEEVDEQLLLECAITEMWEHLGGYDIEGDKFLYHVWFMQFCDICFTAMEKDLFKVTEDGEIHINSELLESLKESVHDFKTKTSTNDNTFDGGD